MEETSIKKQKLPAVKRGSFDETLLYIVIHLDPDGYGLNIQETLKLNGKDVALPNIYATLKKLETLGLLQSSWTEPRPERGGRRRHVFRITDDGRSALAEAEKSIMSFSPRNFVAGGA